MDKDAFRNIQKRLKLTSVEVSKALDVELFTVQMWGCGLWPVPRSIAKFLRLLLSTKRDNEAIYSAGWGRGRNAGLKECRLTQVEGYTSGHVKGYTEGQDFGRRAGYSEGYAAAMEE